MKMHVSLLKSVILGAAIVASASTAIAQAVPSGSPEVKVPKFEVYAGYGDIEPLSGAINGHDYKQVGNENMTVGITDYFKHNLGIELEAQYFNGPSKHGEVGQCRNGACDDRDQMYYTAVGGPVLRFPKGRFVPFVHVMGGGGKVNGPVFQALTWGYEVQGGGGIDYVFPWFHDSLALRIPQVDFQYYHATFGPGVVPTPDSTGVANIAAIKVMAAVVFRFGDQQPPRPLTAACNISPSSIYPGDPVTVSGSLVNINPKKKAIWTWATTGGQLTPGDGGASIATTGLAPGDYTVTGKVSNGNKAYEQASCTGSFSVKTYDPPTLTCSADPSTIMPGTPVSITANGMSPQNRMLTYSYSSTAGQMTATGAHASLATAGVGPGTIGITCNVVDDLGKTATASTSVSVSTPPVLALPEARSLCSVSFERDHKRPARVDNEGKGCLDDVALTLNHDTTSKLVVVGSYAPDESPSVGAGRALNVRAYLTQEKGVDPSRIELRQGSPADRSAQDILLPAGAVYSDAGTTVLDPSTIKVTGPAYGVPGAPTKKHRKRKVY